ncbi:M48 family metallopeptidase [uncultured Sphingorhabdus sp.]|uniref:M48 family metallopeptidase n=1 Tax=uncultured Sphingorhabdus sp. TaxID=1686106 RepID=UPI00261AB3FA|nr:M48 family metallopeptidase [uncultured Sphingorhabdus sp.]HMS21066.1 M48 family metallopeptidase [Sphingorhabdus sp.]
MTTFFDAWHFDGQSAVRRKVEIQTIGSQFFLLEQERRHGPFHFDELRFLEAKGDSKVYGLSGKDGWRLGIRGHVPTELAPLLPASKTYGGLIDRLGLGKASFVFAGISAAVVAVVLLSPQWLAPLIPSSVEAKLGNALVGDFGGRFCDTPKGKAALAKLTRSLDDHPEDLQVEVANIDMLNAVALPGGKVLLFQGLLSQAKSPDEVAGVLAHEIGHVRERHVMQGLLRQMGLAVVLGGFDGSGGSTLNSLLSTTYTRDSEREADDHSLKALKQANISPVGAADFFNRLASMDGSRDLKDRQARTMASYTSSHPLSDERRKLFENAVVKGSAYKPALTADEWQELKTMCAQDKDVKSGWGFDIE